MTSIATFVRRTPSARLRDYFCQSGITLPADIDWSGPPTELAPALTKLVERFDESAKTKVLNDTDRISAMSDEPGQTALYGVARDRATLDRLANGHARSAWMFVHEPDAFRHAEEARYTDEHRRGRMWDGFVGQPGLPLRQSPEAMERFKAAVRQHFRSQNVHVDIFARERGGFEGETFRLTQATVYRDGPANDVPEFVNGRLAWRPRKPVYEAALTYEADTGVIEVVARDRDSRELLVHSFSEQLLGAGCAQERLPFREFNLDVLLQPYGFPTDPADGIESVQVTQLRLMPLDNAGERVTLECSRQTPHTIWDMAAQRFGSCDPLRGGWVVTKAKLVIRFRRQKGARLGRTLPLTVTMPHGCDLKDRSPRETMIGRKYLTRWQLVEHV